MTNDLKEQLQDCPFCGGQMVNKGYGAVHVAGVGCPIGNLIIDASKWNTRAPDPRITDLEARLAAAEAEAKDMTRLRDHFRTCWEIQLARANEAEVDVNRLREGEARLSLLLNETALARDAASAGEDALAEAARDLDNFMRSEKAYERSGYGPKLRTALAAYKARRKGN